MCVYMYKYNYIIYTHIIIIIIIYIRASIKYSHVNQKIHQKKEKFFRLYFTNNFDYQRNRLLNDLATKAREIPIGEKHN